MSASSTIQNDDVKRTVDAVSWDTLLSKACDIQSAESAHWGEPTSGGFNVVRFLHIHDANSTVLVARVPKVPKNGWTEDEIQAASRRISSEVATMRYVEAHTKIPLPHVLLHCDRADDSGIGSPYIFMSKVEGVPLSRLWRGMNDANRWLILRQVVDIYLELFSHRFQHIGSLFMHEDKETTLYIDGMVIMPEPDSHPTVTSTVSSTTFSNALSFWTEYANGWFRKSRMTSFGSPSRKYDYALRWIVRSLIPSLYDLSLDDAGFSLYPGDFHTQNIMIVGGDTEPRISGVIDWEYARTLPTSSLAQYPLFIVDHPHWELDDPMLARDARDQATFIELMHEAESQRNPNGDDPITRAFRSSHGLYLFEQVIQYPLFFDTLFPELVDHFYGEGTWEDQEFISLFVESLFDGGLREISELFDREASIFEEAERVLGKRVTRWMDKAKFKEVICH